MKSLHTVGQVIVRQTTEQLHAQVELKINTDLGSLGAYAGRRIFQILAGYILASMTDQPLPAHPCRSCA